MFVFGGTLNQEIVFQKYDTEWDKYIDLSKNSMPLNKDKLKDVLPSACVKTASTSELQIHFHLWKLIYMPYMTVLARLLMPSMILVKISFASFPNFYKVC